MEAGQVGRGYGAVPSAQRHWEQTQRVLHKEEGKVQYVLALVLTAESGEGGGGGWDDEGVRHQGGVGEQDNSAELLRRGVPDEFGLLALGCEEGLHHRQRVLEHSAGVDLSTLRRQPPALAPVPDQGLGIQVPSQLRMQPSPDQHIFSGLHLDHKACGLLVHRGLGDV